MSRSVWVAGLVVVGVVAAGCGSESNDTTQASGSTTAASAGTTPAKKQTVGLVTGTKSDPFHIAMSCGAIDEGKALGVEVLYQAPNQYAAPLQIPIVNALAAKDPDGMVVAPTDDKALIPPLKAIADKGIKVSLIDTGLVDSSVAVAEVTEDYLTGGRKAAAEIAKLMGGKGDVMLIAQAPGITTQDNGKKGFEEGLKEFPGIHYVGTEYDQADPTKASSIVAATLARDPNLRGIVTLNGPSAPGVVNGLKRAGKSDEVKFLSFDATPQEVVSLKNGEIDELLFWKPYEIGQLGVKNVVAAMNGQPIAEKKVLTQPLAVTAETADDPSLSKYFYKAC